MRPTHQRPGFSLVLSLTVMALMVLAVLSIAGLLNIETRLATLHQANTQARLSAIASLRMAIGHLQQEAGPDRRVTARADLTADTTQPGWTWATIRNPMWTGVWRTDRPDHPPAWLVSGRHDMPAGAQSVSLSSGPPPSGSPYSFVDYNSSHWLPWQSDYTVASAQTAGANIVALVGDGSATAAEAATTTDPGRPDGRISLPAIASPDVTSATLPRGTGFSYAYWIGDEGIKAKANLEDPRLARPSPSGLLPARATGRNAMELIAGFEATVPGSAFTRLGGHADLPLLTGFNNTPVAPVPATAVPSRRCRPDVTFWSSGVISDSLWGGLRIDLSQVFEQSDSAFINGEFGEGEGSTTLLFWQMSKTSRADPPIMGILGVGKIWQPMWWCDPTGVTGVPNSTPTRYDIAPIYTHNWDDPDNAVGRADGNPQIRGPTWMIIRDYHRLYRQMSWSAGEASIRARTVFPNVVSNERMQAGTGGTYHYSHIFNRMDNPNFSSLRGDPFAADVSSGPFNASTYALSAVAAQASHAGVPYGLTPCIRPVKVASTPYISRQMLMFGLQQDAGQLRIVMSPITVLHNPYNVALNLRRENPGDTAAMRLSFRQWGGWTFSMTCPSVNGGLAWTRSLEELTRALDSTAYGGENMRTYIPEIVLQPGEFRVFSPAAGSPVAFTRVATAGNSYDFLGGFWVPCLTPGGTALAPTATDSFSIGFNTGGAFFARHLMSCWPGDSIMEPAIGSDAMYNKCSEHTELFDSQLNPARNGSAGSITYPAGGVMTQVPGVGSPPRIFAVVDYSVRWPRDPLPYPILTHSNPLALMTRGDATGWAPGGGNASGSNIGTGFATTSPSYRLTVSNGGGNWSTAFEPGDGSARMGLGGASNSSGLGGRTATVLTELPLHPPLSIAQYAHANFGMRDQDPLYCIGSSFATPNVPLDKVVSYRASENWTDVDRAYLANLAIWDRYFLSSASPEPTPPAQAIHVTVVDNFSGAAPPWSLLAGTANDRARTLAGVLDDFVAGTYPLLNARMRIWDGRSRTAMSTTTPTRTDLAVRLGDYKQTAAHLVIDGAFNINSTSVDAWAAVLGGTKRVAMGSDGPTQPSATRNARFPRAARTGAAAGDPRAPWTTGNAWSGYGALDDTQIRLLARAIVDEIRFRTQYAVRTPVDRQLNKGGAANFPARRFRGAAAGTTVLVPTPFLGLSQFVNRFLDVTSPGNAVARAGCLQAAIARAESDGGEITNRVSAAAEVTQASIAGGMGAIGQQSWTPHPAGIELTDPGTRSAGIAAKAQKNQSHAALFAPGSVLQQDILAAIGPNINARSDTFVIRAYAEVRGQAAADATRGRAWVEAVLQRTPDYCNPADAPETNPPAKGVNLALGRRFRVVAARWLGPNDI